MFLKEISRMKSTLILQHMRRPHQRAVLHRLCGQQSAQVNLLVDRATCRQIALLCQLILQLLDYRLERTEWQV